MLNFHVGQKVVCVDAHGLAKPGHRDPLCEGGVYTIRAVQLTPPAYCEASPRSEPVDQVLLHEIFRGSGIINLETGAFIDGEELGYSPCRFRPLIETDISIFTAMLEPRPVERQEATDA